jgi:hypothetical protein
MDRIPFDPYDFFGYLASGLLIVVSMEFLFGIPQVMGRQLGTIGTAILILGIYVAGQAVATPAKAILEDGFVGKILKRPSINLFRKTRPAVGSLIFPGYYKPLPELISKRILSKAGSDGFGAPGEALFLHVRYNSEVVSDEKLMTKLNGFLNKYGFARNLAFTSLSTGIAMIYKGTALSDLPMKKYGTIALGAGVLLFYRYLKFFRQYSYEMFNAYAGKK